MNFPVERNDPGTTEFLACDVCGDPIGDLGEWVVVARGVARCADHNQHRTFVGERVAFVYGFAFGPDPAEAWKS